jgi:hypothetical protein
MKTMAPLVILALAVSVLAAGSAFAAERSLSTEVTLQPMDRPDTYLATVEIRDASSEETLAAPRITFPKGGPATTTTTLSTGEEILFTVQVDADGTKATYTAELRGGGKSLAFQKATIQLGR